MEFGTVKTLESIPLTIDLPEILYPASDPKFDENRRKLQLIVPLLLRYSYLFPKGCTHIVLSEVADEAIAYGNEVHVATNHESSGLMTGHYLHFPDDPEKKISLAETFLKAEGTTTHVTCEFSYQDSVRHNRYCTDYHEVPLVWEHTHPGFGVFYSRTDSKTLELFNAKHQAGIVIDNLQNIYKAYKIVDGKQKQISMYGISLKDIETMPFVELFKYSSTAPSRQFVTILGTGRNSNAAVDLMTVLERRIEMLQTRLKRAILVYYSSLVLLLFVNIILCMK